ncbi:hypothetical protein [Actinomadura sp. CNU-125]|uniref:hypothetical protein n=1 Tax=Actinomadura sp. CNU-125 TaxID=1904961 RepID=UPI0021CC792B|nr:hypothetical protein [Actinomadura sp. CNU-125]
MQDFQVQDAAIGWFALVVGVPCGDVRGLVRYSVGVAELLSACGERMDWQPLEKVGKLKYAFVIRQEPAPAVGSDQIAGEDKFVPFPRRVARGAYLEAEPLERPNRVFRATGEVSRRERGPGGVPVRDARDRLGVVEALFVYEEVLACFSEAVAAQEPITTEFSVLGNCPEYIHTGDLCQRHGAERMPWTPRTREAPDRIRALLASRLLGPSRCGCLG